MASWLHEAARFWQVRGPKKEAAVKIGARAVVSLTTVEAALLRYDFAKILLVGCCSLRQGPRFNSIPAGMVGVYVPFAV